jgi:putative transposase
MPRKARLLLDGIPLHLIQRGNNRSTCFYADDDYAFYLETLDELCRTLDIHLHAYCLMTNHTHLLLTPQKAERVSELMKHLGQRYVQRINRLYRRTGTLWEGRFKSALVASDGYLLACYRYIELNPVRAGMVEHPAEYRWSSYRINAQHGLGQLITPHPNYLALAANPEQRRSAYRELFRTSLEPGLVDQLRIATSKGIVFGNDRFRQEIETATGRRMNTTRGRPPK